MTCAYLHHKFYPYMFCCNIDKIFLCCQIKRNKCKNMTLKGGIPCNCEKPVRWISLGSIIIPSSHSANKHEDFPL